MATADELMKEAFSRVRRRRSPIHKAGVRAELEYLLDGRRVRHAYPWGSADFYEFFRGRDEGRAIWRHYAAKAAASLRRSPCRHEHDIDGIVDRRW